MVEFFVMTKVKTVEARVVGKRNPEEIGEVVLRCLSCFGKHRAICNTGGYPFDHDSNRKEGTNKH